MASGMTPLKRFVVRTTLVVGSTVATILGAETLATVDVKATTVPPALPSQTTAPALPTATTKSAVVSAPPTIVMIRHPPVNGSQQAQNPAVASSPITIQPPRPVAVQPLPPQIIVQASVSSPQVQAAPAQAQPQPPAQPVTRSTR